MNFISGKFSIAFLVLILSMPAWSMSAKPLIKSIYDDFVQDGLISWRDTLSSKYSTGVTHAKEGVVKYSKEFNTYYITLNPADRDGVSVNSLKTLVPTGARVILLNTNETHPASVVVLKVDSVAVLQGSDISILGSKSSLILEAPGIRCNDCSFDMISRLVLLTGEHSRQGTSGNDTGNTVASYLKVWPNYRLIVDDMKIKTVSEAVFLSDGILLNGTIHASERERGGIDNKLLGDTAIFVFSGPVTYSYNENRAVYFDPDIPDKHTTLSADIDAAQFKLTSKGSLTVNSSVMVVPDVLIASVVDDEIKIPVGTVELSSIHGSVKIGGDIKANNNISVSARNEIMITETGMVESGGSIDVVAGKDVELHGVLNGGNISIGGENVRNRGDIESSGQIEIWSEDSVFNEFGAYIVADEVNVKSENGQFLNGSFSYYGGEFDVPPGRREMLDLERSGLFEHVAQPLLSDQMETEVTAHISGRIVRIEAKDVYNVNPVWVPVEYEYSSQKDLVYATPEILVDARYFDRVVINATERLSIKSGGYVINSSAKMQVTGLDGRMSIEGRGISNERYRTLNTFTKVFYHNAANSQVKQSYLEEGYANLPLVYSPPGYLRSAGKLDVVAVSADSYFSNNFGQVWIDGNASFSSNVHLTDLGVELGLVKSGVFRYYQGRLDSEKPIEIGDEAMESYRESYIERGIIQYRTRWRVVSGEPRLVKPLAQRSVFSIAGSLNADTFKPVTLNPFLDTVEQAAEHYYVDNYLGNLHYKDYKSKKIWGRTKKTYTFDYYSNYIGSDYSALKVDWNRNANGVSYMTNIYLEHQITKTQTSKNSPRNTIDDFSQDNDAGNAQTVVNVVDVLSHYWNKVKTRVSGWIADLKEEIKWVM